MPKAKTTKEIKLVCKTCGKKFKANSTRATICPACKKVKALARKTKRQLEAQEAIVPDKYQGLEEIDLETLFPAEVWEERPVDIETFLFSSEYLGRAWVNSKGEKTLFPSWEEIAKQIFPLPMRSPYNTIIFSGATGIGKSSAAMGICAAYYLHIVLCLRDPHAYFDLADQKPIVFAILNIVTKAMGYKNAYGMLHQMLLRSPWFMRRGLSTGGRKPEWYCTTKPVAIEYGCDASHIIGLDILFCLAGDTEIKTLNGGWEKIENLVGQQIRTPTLNVKTGKIELSDTCTVIPTKKTNELYELILEDGSSIRCTPEHRFLLKTGEYVMAKDLTEEDELADSSRCPVCGKAKLYRNKFCSRECYTEYRKLKLYDILPVADEGPVDEEYRKELSLAVENSLSTTPYIKKISILKELTDLKYCKITPDLSRVYDREGNYIEDLKKGFYSYGKLLNKLSISELGRTRAIVNTYAD